MANHFFDTSAAVKRYHQETGTAEVNRLLGVIGDQHYLSRLGVVELHSAFARKVLRGEITQADLQLFRRAVASDLRRKRFQVTRVLARHFREAERLLTQYGVAQSLRTLDALQLAIALDLWHQGVINDLVCADQNLCTVAVCEGLPTINPTTP